MSTQEQARALMMRHHHIVKNRQQSMLNRTAAEVGLDGIENSIDDRNYSSRNNSDRPGIALN
ncbi:hypothetical protein [Chlorogloea sp. CCALA 695]|uniref:hypothetical protein n=1 Tax=Chlorogloea sp. CCALA 695 TaxID=2107693 RepID=UPI000D059627|nr:hypothetical protein [Chlorogloea sp. CCALA 695]PSB34581.1 hypothetical protein C7B70_03755 [Chlorogloea sp. CCALA 695]